MRMHIRRFTRLTDGFSKKAENHAHAVALHFMHYNFCKVHSTIRMTPAMQAGVTQKLWDVVDLVRMVEEREAHHAKPQTPSATIDPDQCAPTGATYGVRRRKKEDRQMNGTTLIDRRMLVIGIGTALVVAPALGQTDKVKASMEALKAKTAQLGAPKINGSDAVAGKDVAALYFGTIKMNNHFDEVDAVVKEHSGTATLFVKSANEYVRVATNVKKDDGSRAIGTVLDPNGPVFPIIQKGEAYYGDAMILGKPYVTGYDPIRDAAGNVIGIYYVGYLKN